MPVTAAQLRTQSREFSDKENDQHTTDAEIDRRVDYGYRSLWNLARQATKGDLFITSATFTLTLAAPNYTLPTDFGATRVLYWNVGTATDDYITVPHFAFEEAPASDRSFRVMGTLLRVSPASAAAGNYTLWYEQKYTELAGAGNMNAALEEFREYPSVCAAIGMRDKEESDTSFLRGRKAELEGEIYRAFATRDGAPDRIVSAESWGERLPRLPR